MPFVKADVQLVLVSFPRLLNECELTNLNPHSSLEKKLRGFKITVVKNWGEIIKTDLNVLRFVLAKPTELGQQKIF